jgi:hypothetical protein
VVVLATLSAIGGLIPTAGLAPENADATVSAEVMGVLLVGQLFFTALPPLLRRLQATDERPIATPPTVGERLAADIAEVADRLERLDAGADVRAECERLRRIARSARAA